MWLIPPANKQLQETVGDSLFDSSSLCQPAGPIRYPPGPARGAASRVSHAFQQSKMTFTPLAHTPLSFLQSNDDAPGVRRHGPQGGQPHPPVAPAVSSGSHYP